MCMQAKASHGSQKTTTIVPEVLTERGRRESSNEERATDDRMRVSVRELFEIMP
jgi:hypothetical protein